MATREKEKVRQVVKKLAAKRKLSKRKEASKKTKTFKRELNEGFEKHKSERKTELKRREDVKGSHKGAGVGSRAQQIAIIMAKKEGRVDAKRDKESMGKMDRVSKSPNKHKKFKRKGK